MNDLIKRVARIFWIATQGHEPDDASYETPMWDSAIKSARDAIRVMRDSIEVKPIEVPAGASDGFMEVLNNPFLPTQELIHLTRGE